jgi:hypothetical protein
VVPVELSNEEGVEFYIMCCERPLFTLDVEVGVKIFWMQFILQERLWFQEISITRLGVRKGYHMSC